MTPKTVVLAQLEVDNCTAELYLNGVPVVRIAPHQVPISNAAVEDMIIPGDNTLEVLVEPGQHPSVARSDVRRIAFRPMKATARLLRIPDDEPGLAEHGEVLAETTYSWSSSPPDERDFPASMVTSVDLGAAHGRWSWQDAPVLSQSTELFDEACAQLDAVETAIRRADTNMLVQLIEPKFEDTLRAYPAYTDALLRAEIDTLMQFAALGDDPVPARDPAQHDFRLVAGGRMLQLLDRDWSTSLSVRHHERNTPQPYRISLARLGQHLRIVR